VSQVTHDIVQLLTRELEGFRREIQLFPDDDSVWRTVPGVTNSAGNLAIHVAGGLQYMVGALLGGTGYVRNREAEFSRRSGTRTEIVAEIDRAIVVVRDVLLRLPQDRLADDLPEAVMGVRFRTGIFLLHLCAHAGFHLGQAGYLRRMMTGDTTSSGPLPLAPLAM
jgi:hypothetical protein